MSLTEAQFHDRIDRIQQQVEDAFDASELDVDLDSSGGVLTIHFENGSQLILSRQPALRQLWIAARSGGFHLDLDADGRAWRTTDRDLPTLLTEVCRQQGGDSPDFSALG